MAAGMITNFNQAAAAQHAQMEQLRRAQQQQQSLSTAYGCGQLDTAPSQERMTRGQLRNNWYEAMGPAAGVAAPAYANYQGAFGTAPFIQNFQSPLAQDMTATAGMLISQGGAPGSANLSDSLLQSRTEGMSPKTIQDLQKFLMAQGLDVGRAGCDGKLGPDTHKALMKFIAAGQSTAAAPTTYSAGLRRNYQASPSLQSMVC